jgi:hypothetical protein
MSLHDISELSPEFQAELAEVVVSGLVRPATVKLTLKDGTKRETTVYLFPEDVERMPEVAEYLQTVSEPALQRLSKLEVTGRSSQRRQQRLSVSSAKYAPTCETPFLRKRGIKSYSSMRVVPYPALCTDDQVRICALMGGWDSPGGLASWGFQRVNIRERRRPLPLGACFDRGSMRRRARRRQIVDKDP